MSLRNNSLKKPCFFQGTNIEMEAREGGGGEEEKNVWVGSWTQTGDRLFFPGTQAVFSSVQFSSPLGGAQLIASQRCAGFGVNSRNWLSAYPQPLPHTPPPGSSHSTKPSSLRYTGFPLAVSHLVVYILIPLFYSSRRAGERLREVSCPGSSGPARL